jgi:hypothetical protein
VTGLIDGVGSFTYSRSGKQLAVYFAVKVSSGGEVLEDLKQFFGAGAIYTTGPSNYFRIQKREELRQVLEHFDRFQTSIGFNFGRSALSTRSGERWSSRSKRFVGLTASGSSHSRPSSPPSVGEETSSKAGSRSGSACRNSVNIWLRIAG